MTKVEKIEQEIRKLRPRELSDFREWFRRYDAEEWDRQLEADIRAGRLDQIGDKNSDLIK